MKELTIIYASSTGNTLCVSEFLKERLDNSGFLIELQNADVFDPGNLTNYQTIIFATSTWEHGEIHPFFNKILDSLHTVHLSDVSCAFIGTGDRRYEPVLFCGGMEKLRKGILDRGSKELLSPLRINGDPRPLLDEVVANWCDKLIQKLHTE